VKILNKYKNRFLKRLTKKILKSEGQRYADLFNRKVSLLNIPVKLEWDGKVYTVHDGELPGRVYQFRHEHQGHMAYCNGFQARAQNLGGAYFLSRIDFKDGDVVFDCGANVGDLKLWFEVNGLHVDYVGFEPSPIEFACLRQNVKPSRVHNVGLWDDDGEMTFYVSSQGADSSLIEPPEYDEKITVATRKLASFVDRNIKLLKLEAEGAEPEILDGLGEKLSRIEYVSADLGFERGLKAESTFVPVANYLLTNNFELVEVGHRRICALFRNKAFPS
jgi:FkbM family methyltransferase